MKSYSFSISIPTPLGNATVKHTVLEVASLDEALTKVKASLNEAYGEDNYKIFHYEEVKQ